VGVCGPARADEAIRGVDVDTIRDGKIARKFTYFTH